MYVTHLIVSGPLGKAIKGNREAYTVATKFGALNGVQDASPAAVERSIAGSLERLEISCVDLYYLHRVDPKTPIEVGPDTVIQPFLTAR